MKNKFLIALVLVAGAFVYFKFYANSDKQEIRNIISELEENLEYEKALQPMAVLGRVKRIHSHIADDFTATSLNGASKRKVDLDKIKEGALIGARYFPSIDIFTLPAIIDVKGAMATASFQATISGRDQQSVEFRELFDIKLGLTKKNGKWLCSSISTERLTPEDE